MTKPTAPLLDVLRAARHALEGKSPYRHLTNEINAHIAWRESGECVEAGETAIINGCGTYEDIAKAAIKAMEGGE